MEAVTPFPVEQFSAAVRTHSSTEALLAGPLDFAVPPGIVHESLISGPKANRCRNRISMALTGAETTQFSGHDAGLQPHPRGETATGRPPGLQSGIAVRPFGPE
jgi:hypothetical protein